MTASSKLSPTADYSAIPLPKGWTDYTLLAVLHIITLARIVLLNTVHRADDNECDVLNLRAENERLRSEIGLLQSEIEIKDARFARLEPKNRPHYSPTERFAILSIRAMRGLSSEQTATRFQVAVQTIINWMQKIDKNKTVQMPERTNKYPDFVRFIVQQFKLFCPMLGRYKIADILCRAGLHLSASTVKRIIDEPPQTPAVIAPQPEMPKSPTTIQPQYPNHIWSLDLTVVSTADGFWTPLSKDEMIDETELFFDWYNEHRPHTTLKGKTPNEAYFNRCAANSKPYIETRLRMKQRTDIAGKANSKIKIRLDFLEGRLHLPILKVERV